jgi:hypothetical protein
MALISSSVFDVATNVVELIALERGTSVVTVILIDIFQGTCVLIGSLFCLDFALCSTSLY